MREESYAIAYPAQTPAMPMYPSYVMLRVFGSEVQIPIAVGVWYPIGKYQPTLPGLYAVNHREYPSPMMLWFDGRRWYRKYWMSRPLSDEELFRCVFAGMAKPTTDPAITTH